VKNIKIAVVIQVRLIKLHELTTRNFYHVVFP